MTDREVGIGIDLGTSNSAVCRLDTSSGRYDFLFARGDGGVTEIPSAVARQHGNFYFGVGAVRREASDASKVVRNFKRLLRSNTPVVIGDEKFEPVDLTREFLRYLKDTCERSFGHPVTRAVVTVPAYDEYDVDYQARIRDATIDPDGGPPLFESIATVKEPDAVLLSLIDTYLLIGKTVLVFDMGGGTLDVTIRRVEENSGDPFRPYLRHAAVFGSDMAGARLTDMLGEYALAHWEAKNRFTFSDEERDLALRMNFGRLDDVKRQLSTYGAADGMASSRSELCHLAFPGKGEGYYDVDLPASLLTEVSRPVCEAALDTVKIALDEAGLLPSEVDAYFTVGGTSQLPYMQHLLREYFGKPPTPQVSEHGFIDPYLAVSKGAAVHDLGREEGIHSVPNTTPILEQVLSYDISLLVNSHLELKVLAAKGAMLPTPVFEQVCYMPQDSDNVDIHLYRGSGSVQDAVSLARRTVYFPEVKRRNSEVRIRVSIDGDGFLAVQALSDDGELLTAFTASTIRDTEN